MSEVANKGDLGETNHGRSVGVVGLNIMDVLAGREFLVVNHPTMLLLGRGDTSGGVPVEGGQHGNGRWCCESEFLLERFLQFSMKEKVAFDLSSKLMDGYPAKVHYVRFQLGTQRKYIAFDCSTERK